MIALSFYINRYIFLIMTEDNKLESITLSLVTDEIIVAATTEEIDHLSRRLHKQLCLRKPVDDISKLNLWSQKNRKRTIKYWFGRDVSGWVGTISIYNEEGLRFIVTKSIIVENEQPRCFKKQLKNMLAAEMIIKLNI